MPDLQSAERVHLVGIGGSGMSALASLLLQMGKTVSGSDEQASGATRQLAAMGATIYGEHAESHVDGADYVVRSAAVPAENVEVRAAEAKGLPSRKLAEAVSELMQGRSTVAIAGTHGKTTTTTLVATLLQAGGLDPLALIGADTPQFPLGARAGEGPFVIEADEYDRRFLQYWPEVAVVTSIEPDHLDYFRDLDEIRGVFQELVDRLPAEGRLVVCADDACAGSLSTNADRVTYGFASDADWVIGGYSAVSGGGSAFEVTNCGRTWSVTSTLTGEHNARNATAAMVVAEHFGVGLRTCLAALETFEGPRRRFETKGHVRGVWIVDDYSHHPTEVAALLAGARGVASGAVWIVFQPHTTNRTYALLDEFGAALRGADRVLVLPIYRPSGREAAGRPVTSADLVKRVDGAQLVEDFEQAAAVIESGARAGDLVLTVGAGDVTRLSDVLVERLGA